MAASMEEDVTSLRPESWLIHRAKSCLKTDGCAAKAWLITARTLFPQNFDIKFEAYEVEKNARNIKLAAKDLQEMLSSFKEEPRLNQELQAVSDALQAEGADPKTALYKDIFSALPAETQRQMLLSVISQKQDVLHQCKATLLILRRFPDLVPDTGVNLAESLLSAEKHAHFHTALNCYRKYLVHDLLPIMLNCKEASLAHKQLYKWLQKSIEFYISYITQPPPLDAGLSSPDMMSPTKKLTMSFSGKRLQAIQGLAEKDSHIPRPWQTLFDIVTATGQQLGWEIGDFFMKTSREAQWQEILLLHNKCQQSDHSGLHRQLLYCTLILLLQCIHDYQTRMDSGLFTGSSNHLESIALMEGFKADGDEGRVHGPKHKKLKVESTIPQIHSNSNIPDSNVLMQNMLTAFKCWELLHVDSLEKDFKKLHSHLKAETWAWLKMFEVDMLMYQGSYREAVNLLLVQKQDSKLRTNLQLASCYFCQGNLAKCCDVVLGILGDMAFSDVSTPSQLQEIVHSGRGRHMNLLRCTSSEIMPYCLHMLLACCKEKAFSPSSNDDMALGHMLVLLQYDWPKHEALLLQAVEKIKAQGCFTYNLFFNYIINIDILEEFAYIKSHDGGKLNLDILPTSTKLIAQQRTVTRGVNKGVKEDFRLTMEKQVARSEENIEALIREFLANERELLQENLL